MRLTLIDKLCFQNTFHLNAIIRERDARNKIHNDHTVKGKLIFTKTEHFSYWLNKAVRQITSEPC